MPVDFPEVVDVWESSVRATHDFLCETDIHDLRPLIVNEYLPAVGFYEHLGFETVGRSPFDPQGKPFPIRSMELKI